MMKNNWKILLGVGLAFLAASCETDLKVNADYTRTPIIYGVLNKSETQHIIKISKTFLGEGNAYDFAKVADSSRIQGLQAFVEAWKNGNPYPNQNNQKKYLLRDTVIPGKPAGTFYSGDQFAYVFDEANLDTTIDYKISFQLDGKEISASTKVVGNTSFTIPNPNSPLELVDYDIRTNGNATGARNMGVTVKISNPTVGVETEIKGTFHYTEVYLDNSTAQKTVSVNLGKTINGKLTYLTGGFWNAVENTVKEDANVLKRIPGDFELDALTYTKDLQTYIVVSNPVSGVLQEQPEYTNVNNGLGIWASVNETKLVKPMNERSEAFLILAPKFIPLKFCSTNYFEDRIRCK